METQRFRFNCSNPRRIGLWSRSTGAMERCELLIGGDRFDGSCHGIRLLVSLHIQEKWINPLDRSLGESRDFQQKSIGSIHHSSNIGLDCRQSNAALTSGSYRSSDQSCWPSSGHSSNICDDDHRSPQRRLTIFSQVCKTEAEVEARLASPGKLSDPLFHSTCVPYVLGHAPRQGR